MLIDWARLADWRLNGYVFWYDCKLGARAREAAVDPTLVLLHV